jgi:hypothetical protein
MPKKPLELYERWYHLFVVADFHNMRIEVWVFVKVIENQVTKVLDPPLCGFTEYVGLVQHRF